MLLLILIIISIFFAMNMGASGIAPSFCSCYGAKILERKSAVLLFAFFVILGASLFGNSVVKTLSGGIVPAKVITIQVALVIIFSASVSLAIANILKIPQSTSWVTVFSLVATGIYYGDLNFKKIYVLSAAWVILPLISYFLTLYLHKFVYPPRNGNLKLYEKIFANEKKLKTIAILTSCYVAFSIGTNNVANVVGPLKAANVFNNPFVGLLVMAPIFGIGALLMGRGNLSSLGCELVPLGIITSTTVSIVTASLLIVASIFGIPQSLVQLNAASIFAVSHTKNGFSHTASHNKTRKTFFVWLISPVISFSLTLLILQFLGGKFK